MRRGCLADSKHSRRRRRAPAHSSARRNGVTRRLPSGARWLVAATASSSIGDGLALVAFPLLSLRYTHDPVLVAGVAVAQLVPGLALSLPAGVLADRWPRRAMAVGAEWVRLVGLGIFALALALGQASLVALYATVVLIGLMDQLYQAAAFASLPAMVPAGQLGKANSRLWAADVAGEQFAGQGLGGLALAASRALPFAADAVSFGASGLMVGRAIPRRPAAPEPAGGRRRLRAELGEGISWFASHRVLRLLAPLVGSFAFCQLMAVSILVLYARLSLHVSTAGYGLLMAAAAVGNVIGALVADRVSARLGAVPATVAAGAVAGLAYIGLGAWHSVAGFVGFLLLESLAVPVGSVASIALRQRIIPSELLGRVGMVFRVFLFAAMPLGALVGGLLASRVPYREVFVVAGAVQLVALAVISVRLVPLARTDQQVIDLTAEGAGASAGEGSGGVAAPAVGAGDGAGHGAGAGDGARAGDGAGVGEAAPAVGAGGAAEAGRIDLVELAGEDEGSIPG